MTCPSLFRFIEIGACLGAPSGLVFLWSVHTMAPSPIRRFLLILLGSVAGVLTFLWTYQTKAQDLIFGATFPHLVGYIVLLGTMLLKEMFSLRDHRFALIFNRPWVLLSQAGFLEIYTLSVKKWPLPYQKIFSGISIQSAQGWTKILFISLGVSLWWISLSGICFWANRYLPPSWFKHLKIIVALSLIVTMAWELGKRLYAL